MIVTQTSHLKGNDIWAKPERLELGDHTPSRQREQVGKL